MVSLLKTKPKHCNSFVFPPDGVNVRRENRRLSVVWRKRRKICMIGFFQLQSIVQSGVTNVFIFLFAQLIEKQN